MVIVHEILILKHASFFFLLFRHVGVDTTNVSRFEEKISVFVLFCFLTFYFPAANQDCTRGICHFLDQIVG